jgi:hypothetical protein
MWSYTRGWGGKNIKKSVCVWGGGRGGVGYKNHLNSCQTSRKIKPNDSQTARIAEICITERHSPELVRLEKKTHTHTTTTKPN